MAVLTEMYYTPKVYEDKTVKLTGFYYKEADYDENAFLIARMLVSCCAADAQVAGFRCEWENIGTLEQGQWYEVEGKVRLDTTYNELFKMDETLATIEVIRAVQVNEPASPYIFP
jgi:putative membrane protein